MDGFEFALLTKILGSPEAALKNLASAALASAMHGPAQLGPWTELIITEGDSGAVNFYSEIKLFIFFYCRQRQRQDVARALQDLLHALAGQESQQ